MAWPYRKLYKIHMGITKFTAAIEHPFTITSRSGNIVNSKEGAVSENGLVMETYIHGIFDNDRYRRVLLNNALRKRKGLGVLAVTSNRQAEKQANYNKLADIVRSSLNMALLYKIMAGQ